MKVLIVCSGNAPDFSFEKNQAFIYDQVNAVKKIATNIEFSIYTVSEKGLLGYLKEISRIRKHIIEVKPDVIHAHGGHIGFLCLWRKNVPLVVTFHGSDINNKLLRGISSFVSILSDCSVFVSEQLKQKLTFKNKNSFVVPCGVDFDLFYPMDKNEAKVKAGIDTAINYILFSSSFDNWVKNFPLAKKATEHFPEYQLMEIKNRTRKEVNYLLNGAELVLLTSFTEGSPQITKEALACNKKIVSVKVGDIEEQLEKASGCFLCNHSETELVNAIAKALEYSEPMDNRQLAEKYNSEEIANRIIEIYKSVAVQC